MNSSKAETGGITANSSGMIVLTQAEFSDVIRQAKSEAWDELSTEVSLSSQAPNPYRREQDDSPVVRVARKSSRSAVEVVVSWALVARGETLHAFTTVDTRALCGIGKRTPAEFNRLFGAAAEFCIDCFREYNLLVQTQGDGMKNENNHGIFV